MAESMDAPDFQLAPLPASGQPQHSLLQDWLNLFASGCIQKIMSWWKTKIDGKMSVIIIYSFNWKVFLVLLLGPLLGGIAFFIYVWLKTT